MSAACEGTETAEPDHASEEESKNQWFKTDVIWYNVFVLLTLNVLALYAVPLLVFGRIKWQTLLFTAFLGYLSTVGTVVGAHRHFAHKSFKAVTPLKIFLLACNSLSAQFCVWRWARDHRIHHKHSDSDGDPYSAGRGFFYAHLGWIMLRTHPAVIKARKTIDLSDLNNDPNVMFQKRHELKLVLALAAASVIIPVVGWNESLKASFLVPCVLRLVCCWHCAFMINSWGHYFGSRPYDKTIYPVQSAFVTHLTLGEGWHNYHHTFPWDYKASELGLQYNPMTTFINACARLGLAYDLREASDNVVKARIGRTGDGTHLSL